jgi:hypothetical protein
VGKRIRRYKEWSRVVEQWRLSGLSIKEFCKQESIGESRFYEVRKQIETGINKRSKFSKPLFLPVQIKPEEKISLPIATKSTPVLMEVTLSNGCYLRFPSIIDTQELTKITMALTEKC